MTKEELDFIDAKNVSDEKKLDIFKEAKFKEEDTKCVQAQEKTKCVQAEEQTKCLQAEEQTKCLQAEEETKRIKIIEEEKTKREYNHERSVQVTGISKFIVVIIEFLSSLTASEPTNIQDKKNIESEEIEE